MKIMEVDVGITGVGYCLGEKKIDNQTMADIIEVAVRQKKFRISGSTDLTEKEVKELLTTPDWIESRTGIKSRYFTSGSTSDLAAQAVQKGISSCGRKIDECEFIIVATVSPDYRYSPPTAALVVGKINVSGNLVRDELGLKNCLVVDVSSACTSFGAGLLLGYSLIKSGLYKFGVVVGADKMSSTVDMSNRNFSILLGDAAVAFVLESVSAAHSSFPYGAISFFAGTEPAGALNIMARAGGSANQLTLEDLVEAETDLFKFRPDMLWQDGKKVLKEVINLLSNPKEAADNIVVGKAINRAGISLDNIDIIFPHQANLRINDNIESNLRERGYKGLMYNTIQQFGNTTSAAVPLGVAKAWEDGTLKIGDKILLLPFGGGYTFIAIFITWTADAPRRI
ncbi:MAG: ketoacyl-ACP synthase III [Patescibacteria group bacterium]